MWLLLGSPAASGTAARSTRCALRRERRLAMGGFAIRVPVRGGGAGTRNVSSRWRNSVQCDARGTPSSEVAERIAATCQHCRCSVRSGRLLQRPAAARRGCHLARGRPRPLRRSATPSPNHHHVSCGALIGRATGSYLDIGAKARAAASANRVWGLPPCLHRHVQAGAPRKAAAGTLVPRRRWMRMAGRRMSGCMGHKSAGPRSQWPTPFRSLNTIQYGEQGRIAVNHCGGAERSTPYAHYRCGSRHADGKRAGALVAG
jgi:hypothetical protein